MVWRIAMLEEFGREKGITMSDTNFWIPVYQCFDFDVPLSTPEELEKLYVQRVNSPVEELVSSLDMEGKPAKFLLAGHIGSGKTTELKKLEYELSSNYSVIWVDTATALDRYNIGYAEVVALIGFEIYRTVIQDDWGIDEDLLGALRSSLMTVAEQTESTQDEGLGVPEFLQKFGLVLKGGLSRKTTAKVDIRPSLSTIIRRVNSIIKAAEKQTAQKLLVIVDGLDRHNQATALEMFSDSLLAEPCCHIIYTIPISLRYCSGFRQAVEVFESLDLTNPPVFKCDRNGCPTQEPDEEGRKLLASAVHKRLASLGTGYQDIFAPDALELLCEKSGGVMRDLIRLAGIACKVAKRKQAASIDIAIAEEAVKKLHNYYRIYDFHFPELAAIHRTGQLTTNKHSLPERGEFVICDDLLQNKLALGYHDEATGRRWYDINPILIEDLKPWKATNPESHAS